MTEQENSENISRPDWHYFRLPPFSPLAIQVMQIVNQDDVPVDELNDLISSDQAFAGAVLTLANSALYAHRFPVMDVLHAINRLGLKNVQGICLNVAMATFLGKQLTLPTVRTFWSHNLACGFIAEVLATGTGIDQGSAFTCGLMHDVGRLALSVMRPSDYVRLLETYKGSPSSILLSEKEMFGFDHCEAGHELVKSWNLPLPFNVVIQSHHASREKTELWSLADLIHLSCRLADSVGYAAFSGCEITPYADLINESPSEAMKTFYPDAKTLAYEIHGKIKLIQGA